VCAKFVSITRVSATSRVDNLNYNKTFTTTNPARPSKTPNAYNSSSSSSGSSSSDEEEEKVAEVSAADVTRGTAYVSIYDRQIS